jgi:formylglycine-generating enzyme required for sulfatase activity
LDPWYGPARGFDFAREVQPVLNRYCVSCHDQGNKTIDLGGGQSIELVRFGQPYWMGTCEISNAQFQQFDPHHFSRYYVKRHESRGDDRGMMLDQPDQPALRVSWNRAMAFCQWLSEKTGLNVSLPTEQQWETACRAGSGRAFHYGGEDFSQWENMADFGSGEKTVKGGSFLDPPSRCSADARLGYPPWQNVHNAGFRIVVND